MRTGIKTWFKYYNRQRGHQSHKDEIPKRFINGVLIRNHKRHKIPGGYQHKPTFMSLPQTALIITNINTCY